jgi:hypothetical protein
MIRAWCLKRRSRLEGREVEVGVGEALDLGDDVGDGHEESEVVAGVGREQYFLAHTRKRAHTHSHTHARTGEQNFLVHPNILHLLHIMQAV